MKGFIIASLHYAELGDIQQAEPLPGKASLGVKYVFSGIGIKICSLVCKRFHETGTLPIQDFGPKIGNKSCTQSVPALNNEPI